MLDLFDGILLGSIGFCSSDLHGMCACAEIFRRGQGEVEGGRCDEMNGMMQIADLE